MVGTRPLAATTLQQQSVAATQTSTPAEPGTFPNQPCTEAADSRSGASICCVYCVTVILSFSQDPSSEEPQRSPAAEVGHVLRVTTTSSLVTPLSVTEAPLIAQYDTRDEKPKPAKP